MSQERPTIRPVTLARLVEVAHLCTDNPQTTEIIQSELEVTRRRARETILEACRIGLIGKTTDSEEETYLTTTNGKHFVTAVEEERWSVVSDNIVELSPHYAAFLGALRSIQPATLEDVLERIIDDEVQTDRTYNLTSVEVLADWAERLGTAQRNAFTGEYYLVETEDFPEDVPEAFLGVYDRLETVAGVDLRQRYLSIPKLREHFCADHRCPRWLFDDIVVCLAEANIGRLELSGAPLDTSAKDAALGIKSITRADQGGLVSTSQSTERVMAGIEQHGKCYYFLAVFDRELIFPEETTA